MINEIKPSQTRSEDLPSEDNKDIQRSGFLDKIDR